MKPYSYSVLRYRHDPTSGEAVNVGVLLYAPQQGFVKLQLDDHYGHLTELFREFCKDDFEMSLAALKAGEREVKAQLREPSLLGKTPETVAELTQALLPDGGGTLRFGSFARGQSRDLEQEASALFQMLVSHQRPEHQVRQRRNDEGVWSVYRQVLALYDIPNVLKPAKVQTPTVPVEFKHTYDNGNKHALQPLSLEYATPADIVAYAAKWKALGDELADTEGFGKLHLLLGLPDKMTPGFTSEHADAIEQSIKLLGRTKVNRKIVREEDAAAYAKELAQDMKAHNVLG